MAARAPAAMVAAIFTTARSGAHQLQRNSRPKGMATMSERRQHDNSETTGRASALARNPGRKAVEMIDGGPRCTGSPPAWWRARSTMARSRRSRRAHRVSRASPSRRAAPASPTRPHARRSVPLTARNDFWKLADSTASGLAMISSAAVATRL
jgi:hypothetical protein